MTNKLTKPILTSLSVLLLASGAVTLLPAAAPALAAPEPSPYPITWELDFTYQTPKRIVVEIPGEPSPRAYWYLPYIATNNTDREQLFLPTFELVTRDGRVLVSDTESSAAVFQAVARRERSPFLKSALENAGTILVGEDQAKYGVAIWEEPNPEPGSFNIFIAGLSGETVLLTDSQGNPVNDADGNPILLRKTKQLDFTVRGDELYADDAIVQTGESWIMR